MALSLSVQYVDGAGQSITSTVSPEADTVTAAATRLGWAATIPDPNLQTQIDTLRGEALLLPRDDPERATKIAQAEELARTGGAIANPVSAEEFCVKHVEAYLVGMLVDTSEIQRKAQEAADAENLAQKAAAAGKLHVDRQVN